MSTVPMVQNVPEVVAQSLICIAVLMVCTVPTHLQIVHLLRLKSWRRWLAVSSVQEVQSVMVSAVQNPIGFAVLTALFVQSPLTIAHLPLLKMLPLIQLVLL